MNDVLDRFLHEATEDDYRRARSPVALSAGHRLPWGVGLVFIAAALLGVVLVAAALSFRSSADARTSTQAALTERVQLLNADVQELQDEVTAQTDTVEQLRGDLLDTDADVARSAALLELANEGGTARVSGPGVVVTIDDAPDADAASLNRVLDRDLQEIANALWRMGAEGVAINGLRLTQTSAIRGAGGAILVNYQPLTRPYVVEAVGTSSIGEGATDLDNLLDLLKRDYGLVSNVTVGDVALPAGETHDSRFARTVPRSNTTEGATSP